MRLPDHIGGVKSFYQFFWTGADSRDLGQQADPYTKIILGTQRFGKFKTYYMDSRASPSWLIWAICTICKAHCKKYTELYDLDFVHCMSTLSDIGCVVCADEERSCRNSWVFQELLILRSSGYLGRWGQPIMHNSIEQYLVLVFL